MQPKRPTKQCTKKRGGSMGKGICGRGEPVQSTLYACMELPQLSLFILLIYANSKMQ
jgi:hypothetical protein